MATALIQLFQKACDGDRDALGNLLEALTNRIHRVAFYIVRNEEDARELANDVGVELCRKAAKGKTHYTLVDDCDFLAIVHQITRRMARKLKTRNKRMQTFDPQEGVPDEVLTKLMDPTSDSKKAEELDDCRLLLKAVKALSGEDQWLFERRYILCLNSSEMSAWDGVEASTTRGRLSKMRERLFNAIQVLDPEMVNRLS